MNSDYAWMQWLYKNLGQIEKTGSEPTDFDREVFSHTDTTLENEMLKGCAATACAALEESGYKSPHDAMAISFQHYGIPCELKPGCIVVFEWDSGGHHVTFCDAIVDSQFVDCIGGNQSSMLKVSRYYRAQIIATRWPIK